MRRIGMLLCAIVLFSATCEVAGSVVNGAKKKRAFERLGAKMPISVDAIVEMALNNGTKSIICTDDQKRSDKVNARLQRKLRMQRELKRKRVEVAVAAAVAARENNAN